jgi:methylated-DNA-[protein]-cysteine S-methyltransferase
MQAKILKMRDEVLVFEVFGVHFKVYLDSSPRAFFDERPEEERLESELGKRLKKDLISYFSGERVSFNYVSLDWLRLTPFQRRVLEETRKIPYGEVATYKELAERIGSDGYRAVGQALKRNPLPVIIPCHRVVGRKTLGGYGGHTKSWIKLALLELEGVEF